MAEEEVKTEEAKVETPQGADDSRKKKHVFVTGEPRSDRGPRRKFERPKSEFDQRVIDIRRVTRVVAGGRRFSFSVAMVLGNKNGSVGFGLGKGGDTASAIEKATRQAKRTMIKVPRTKTNSIRHEVGAKYASAVLLVKPIRGTGLVAGSAVRHVLNLAGIRGVNAKLLSRSKNKINNARVTIEALKKLK